MKKFTLMSFLGLSLVACAPTTQQVVLTPTPPLKGPGIVAQYEQTAAAETTTAPTTSATTTTSTTTEQTTAATIIPATTPAPVSPAPVVLAPPEPAPQTTAASTTQTPVNEWTVLAPLSTERKVTFSKAEQVIDPAKSYRAVLKTSRGDIAVNLDAKAAPLAVNNFVFLALNHFYDGTRFHRVIDGFMAQAGDPQSAKPALKDAWGTGGPGYQFANETSALTFDKAGVLAMANAGRDTNGSQFFITYGPTPFLNGGYTIFGQVVQGQSVVDSLTRTYDSAGPIAGTEADTISAVEIQVQN